MRLKRLHSAQFCVASVWDEGLQQSEITAYLSGVESQFKAAAKGFESLFRRYAQDGRDGLTTELFHEANKKERIWEFVKGRLRIYCFMDADSNILLLSHGIVKKNQKAQMADIRQAAALRDQYIRANENGSLTWETDR